jgi:hypothetical protein
MGLLVTGWHSDPVKNAKKTAADSTYAVPEYKEHSI